jgi:aryl-alcohol dehydrogenase-like predicted oxidoreductase
VVKSLSHTPVYFLYRITHEIHRVVHECLYRRRATRVLQALLPECAVRPMVNQIECHLRSAQRPLAEYCREQDIAVTAYSPLKGSHDGP